MYNIENINHTVFELADFLEYKSIINDSNTCSLSDLRAFLSAPDDEIDIKGVEEGDDKVIKKLQEALGRCSIRQLEYAIYPFFANQNSISCKLTLEDNNVFYIFLLLANRLNMQKESIQSNLDATKLFERLCCLVAKSYLGEHSICEILGTSIKGTFEQKVKDILMKLHIKGEFKNPLGSTGLQKDGGIDLIAWIPFKDSKDSQIIALGQCKTGSNWEQLMKKIAFFQNYSTLQPFVEPEYMFFVAEDFGMHKWEERSRNCGIIFDRIRIMEFLPANIKEIDASLFNDVKSWVEGAIINLRSKINQ